MFTFTLPPNRAAGTICCEPPQPTLFGPKRSPVSGDLLLSLAALSIPARSPVSVIFSWSRSGLSQMASTSRGIAGYAGPSKLPIKQNGLPVLPYRQRRRGVLRDQHQKTFPVCGKVPVGTKARRHLEERFGLDGAKRCAQRNLD